jgi:hypothetical protein
MPAIGTAARIPTARSRTRDRYLLFLVTILAGYALMGKGFAYLGFPPLYIGEIALLTGIIVLGRSGTVIASLATLPSVVLLVTMMWVLVLTIPYLEVYGVDALRDSVIIMYGGFALIVIGLLLEEPRRIDTVLHYYGRLLVMFPAIPVGFWLTKYWGDAIPSIWGPVPIVEIGASAVGTHLAGAAVFVLIGYRKVSVMWIAVWLLTAAMLAATNRGAALAVLVPCVFAIIMLGRLRWMLRWAAVGAVAFAATFAIESTYLEHEQAKDSLDRSVTAHQLAENAMSIFGDSGEQTQGTKEWRLRWWDMIITDTVYGPNFWTGRGFGLNLAEADGFAGAESGPPLRAPHNANMTLLARAGVPGLALWWLLLLCWGGMLLKAMFAARARRHKHWANVFLWVFCYAASIVINATFDVTLEGPVQGIWFWSLFGFGVGSVMVYRAQAGDRKSRHP